MTKQWRIITSFDDVKAIVNVEEGDSGIVWYGYTDIQAAIRDRTRLMARYPNYAFSIVEYVTLRVGGVRT